MNLKILKLFYHFSNTKDTKVNTIASDLKKEDSYETITQKRKWDAKYKKIKNITEIDSFEIEAIDLIMNHLQETAYKPSGTT